MEEKAHLDELQAQYAELQKEYETILQHQKLLEEEKKEKENYLARLNNAVTKIQKVYRGWIVRKALAGKVRMLCPSLKNIYRMTRAVKKEIRRRKNEE